MQERFTWLDWTEDTVSLPAVLDVSLLGFAMLCLAIRRMAILPDCGDRTEGANELLQTNGLRKIVPMKDLARLADAVGAVLATKKTCGKLLSAKNAQARAKVYFDRMIGETEIVYP